MDLFEVLLVLAFIGLPLIEGVLKQRRKRRGSPEEGAPARPTGTLPETEVEPFGHSRPSPPAPSRPADEGPAADMIPADLWEVLTGERRHPEPAQEAPVEEWEIEPGRETPDWMDYRTAESLETLPEEPEPVHYPGEVVSLEVPPPPPDVRHRLFHEKYDALEVEEVAAGPGLPYGLHHALKGPGLRRAILLQEILGPPKGLV